MTNQEALAGAAIPVSSSAQTHARIAFVSALSGFLLFIALHVLKRELNPGWHMVSEYALGRFGWAMTSCFFCLALSCITSAFALFSFARTMGGKIGLLLLLCASGGLALAAIFPTDPITVSAVDASASASLHALSVLIGVPTLAIAALLVSYAIVQQPTWTTARLPLLGFAHLTWISLALTIAVVAIWLPRTGEFGPEVLVGWPNRLMFVAYFGWLGSLSWPIIR